MAIPVKNVLGNPNVTEGNFQIAIEQLRESVIGSGKTYDSANTYMINDTCVYSGIIYYSKIGSNTGNTPIVGAQWGDIADLIGDVVQKTGDTMTGNLNFSGIDSQIGTSTNNALVLKTNSTERLRIDTSGNVLVTGSGGLGYGTGSGGTVTQLTSKATAVTLNKPSGQIVMNNASLAAGATVFFYLNNNTIGTTDTCVASLSWNVLGNATIYQIETSPYGAGGVAMIAVKNLTGGALADAITLNFVVIKGSIN